MTDSSKPSDPPRPIVLAGGCQCGAVRYALYAPPQEASVCHCRMCQKATGGPFAALARVRLADFAWTRGRPASFLSSTIAARDFCAACGTPLSFRFLDDEWIELTIGSLDRPADAAPVRQYGIESLLPWTKGVAALPATSTEANMAAERRARFANLQHPDHDTPPDWRTPRRG
jgi:hypothetical protein